MKKIILIFCVILIIVSIAYNVYSLTVFNKILQTIESKYVDPDINYNTKYYRNRYDDFRNYSMTMIMNKFPLSIAYFRAKKLISM